MSVLFFFLFHFLVLFADSVDSAGFFSSSLHIRGDLPIAFAVILFECLCVCFFLFSLSLALSGDDSDGDGGGSGVYMMGFIIHATLNKIQFACLAFSLFFALVRLHCSSKMDLLFRSTRKM